MLVGGLAAVALVVFSPATRPQAYFAMPGIDTGSGATRRSLSSTPTVPVPSCSSHQQCPRLLNTLRTRHRC